MESDRAKSIEKMATVFLNRAKEGPTHVPEMDGKRRSTPLVDWWEDDHGATKNQCGG